MLIDEPMKCHVKLELNILSHQISVFNEKFLKFSDLYLSPHYYFFINQKSENTFPALIQEINQDFLIYSSNLYKLIGALVK